QDLRARAGHRDRPLDDARGLQAPGVEQAAHRHPRDRHAAGADRAIGRGLTHIDAATEIAGAVAAILVAGALRAGHAAVRVFLLTGRDQAVADVDLGTVELAGQAGEAIDLAVADVTRAGVRRDTRAVGAAVPVATFGGTLAAQRAA